MFATTSELEATVRVPFTPQMHDAASILLEGVEGRVRLQAGDARFNAAAEDPESGLFHAVRDIILSVAARRIGNPEGWLQKRMSDQSTSYADSVAAAVSLTPDEKADIRLAFQHNTVASVRIRRLPVHEPIE